MIVCHCNCIDHEDIETACARLVGEEPWRVLTPVAVYKALGKRPRCGGCLPLAANLIHTRDATSWSRCNDCPLATIADGEVDLGGNALQPVLPRMQAEAAE